MNYIIISRYNAISKPWAMKHNNKRESLRSPAAATLWAGAYGSGEDFRL